MGVTPQVVGGNSLLRMLVDRELQRDEDEPAYFYHSDHLGSAAYLTQDGQVYQTLNYLPYGEDWIENNHFAPADTTRLGIYRFNGKEKDYESGFHYYGARYYWSEVLTGWLSVDAMTDKFPSISGYAYCNNNPVTLMDPDGNSPIKGAVTAAKYIRKAYKIYKKTGKLTAKSLKQAGLSEIVDMAADLYTIFDGNASLGDKILSGVDLVVGTNLNSSGINAAKKALGITDNTIDVINDVSKTEIKINNPRSESKFWRTLDNDRKGRKSSGKGKDKRYYEWDHTHNDIEVYDHHGKYIGSADPNTGEIYKPANNKTKHRNIDL